MLYTHRSREIQLNQWLEGRSSSRNVLLLEGARQVGKSTLAQKVMAGSDLPQLKLNLERDELWRKRIDHCGEFAEFAELVTDEGGLDLEREGILFIDEAQESRRLGQFVRFMQEEWPHTRVMLTGSTLTRLFREDQRYPVGRIERIVLSPFSFSEYLAAIGKPSLRDAVLGDTTLISPSRHETLLSHLDRYLEIGGLPEIVHLAAANEDWRRRRAELLASYEWDFLRLFGEEHLPLVESALRGVANYVSSPMAQTKIVHSATAKEIETLRTIYQRLEAWHLVLLSPQWGPSIERSHRYHPKRYLFDTGMLRELRELALPSLNALQAKGAELRRPLGAVVENQTAIALADLPGGLTGWKRSPSGAEIDFVIKGAGQSLPIECKATQEIKGTHLAGLGRFLDHFDEKLGCVVSFAPGGETQLKSGRRVQHLPLYSVEQLPELSARLS